MTECTWTQLTFAAIVGVVIVLMVFVAALFGSHSGEVAGALGSFIGGVVGAGGAVWAVYLTLSRQRAEEAAKVSAAVTTEVTTFVKYLVGAIEICEQINAGLKIPVQDARYILKNLWADPVVYPAVADRIGLLPHPIATTEFYMRISEVKAMLEALRTKTVPQPSPYSSMQPEYITAEFASKIADSLITTLQLSKIIFGYIDASKRTEVISWVMASTTKQIEECFASAKKSFPDAESFRVPEGQPPPT